MKQSISKIHPLNTLKTNFDGNVYYYNNDKKWAKSSIKIHKAFNKTLDDIKNMDVNINDYVFLYDKKTNYIKYSEDYTRYINANIINDSKYTDEQKYYWVIKNLNISNETSNIPTLSKPISKFNTMYKDGNESSISQICYTTNNDNLTFSVFLKKDESLPTNWVSISLMSDTYNVGVSIKVDISSITKSQSLTPMIIDNEYNTSSSNITNNENILSNYSGGIEYYISEEYGIYYRLYICCKFNAYQQTRCKLNILDANGNYTYNVGSAIYKLFIGGFQLEKNKIAPNPPSTYILTYNDKPNSMNIFQKMYVVVDDDKNVQERSHKLFYATSLKEFYDSENNIIYADSIVPSISTKSVGDVVVVTSILSFANDIDENTKRINKRNTNKDSKTKLLITIDDIPESEIKRLTTDCAVQFGDKSSSDDPINSIHYNYNDKNYKIKKSQTEYDVFKVNDKSNYTKIVKAMTYNQGYFETWSEKGNCRFRHGFNTGGGQNFWK